MCKEWVFLELRLSLFLADLNMGMAKVFYGGSMHSLQMEFFCVGYVPF
jgi:hypothetical protein